MNYLLMPMKLNIPVNCYIRLCLIAISLSACDGPFPSASKPIVPDDHTTSIRGVLHKPGYEHPYLSESGCSDSDCHKDDLDGGVGEIDGEKVIVSSCFQCHETLWEDDIDENIVKGFLRTYKGGWL